MPNYCTKGIKATVNYKFNTKKKTYIASHSPIEVTVINNTGFQEGLIKYGRSVTVPFDRGIAEVYIYGIAYTAPDYPNCPSAYKEIFIGNAAPGTALSIVGESYPNACTNAYFQYIPATNHYDKITQYPGDTGKIGLKFKSNQCSIKITESNGTIFTDSGDCPIEFTVACGDECPEGFIKCKTTNYPGYYCLPCNEIKSELRVARKELKRFNNG